MSIIGLIIISTTLSIDFFPSTKKSKDSPIYFNKFVTYYKFKLFLMNRQQTVEHEKEVNISSIFINACELKTKDEFLNTFFLLNTFQTKNF